MYILLLNIYLNNFFLKILIFQIIDKKRSENIYFIIIKDYDYAYNFYLLNV